MTPAPRSGRENSGSERDPVVEHDEYRIKLYKVACRVAQDERERQLQDYEARLRDRT